MSLVIVGGMLFVGPAGTGEVRLRSTVVTSYSFAFEGGDWVSALHSGVVFKCQLNGRLLDFVQVHKGYGPVDVQVSLSNFSR